MGSTYSKLAAYARSVAGNLQLGKRLHRSKATISGVADNGLNGVCLAAMVWNLGRMNRQTKIKSAMELRQVAKVLGMPPVGKDDENLAGGNISINNPLWLFLAMLLGAVMLWLFTQSLPKATPTTTVTTPTSTTTAPPSSANPDYIEFYRP
jgi:hypothetical protein